MIAVIPDKDSAAIPSKEAAQAVLGIVYEVVKFGGPAYRTIPKIPLVLYQWLAGARTKLPLVVEAEGKPPVLCVETWAGSAMLSKEWVRLGFAVKAYECLPDGVYLPDGDLSPPQVQAELQDDIT